MPIKVNRKTHGGWGTRCHEDIIRMSRKLPRRGKLRYNVPHIGVLAPSQQSHRSWCGPCNTHSVSLQQSHPSPMALHQHHHRAHQRAWSSSSGTHVPVAGLRHVNTTAAPASRARTRANVQAADVETAASTTGRLFDPPQVMVNSCSGRVSASCHTVRVCTAAVEHAGRQSTERVWLKMDMC